MTDRIPITVVIATLNEAHRLGAALEAVGWADEVIVADAGSTDGTTDIARSAGARVMTVAGQHDRSATERRHRRGARIRGSSRWTPTRS
jgi:glycosyltransferase involved in cell wall biosynthesis